MRKVLISMGASLFFAGAAFAGTGEELVANGATVSAGPMSYTISFDGEGGYSNSIGESGTYELTGDQICLTPEGGETRCVDLPEDKASGDSFEVAGPGGRAAKMTIN